MGCIIKVCSPREWDGVMDSVSLKDRYPFQVKFPQYLSIEKDEQNKIRVYSAPNIEAYGDGALFMLYNWFMYNKEEILFDILL